MEGVPGEFRDESGFCAFYETIPKSYIHIEREREIRVRVSALLWVYCMHIYIYICADSTG